MANYTPVVPNLYATWRSYSERWAAGIGVNAPFGLKTIWPADGPLRYVTTDSDLRIVQYSPTIAFRVNDRFMVGGGIAYTTGKASLKSAVDVGGLNFVLSGGPFVAAPDGEQELEGNGDGVGADVGVLFKPKDGHAVAVSYRSDVKIGIKGKTHLRGLSNESAGLFGGDQYATDTKTTITLPPSVTVGYAYSPNKWTLAVDGEWVGYSSFHDTTLTFSGESDANRLGVLGSNNPIPRLYKDKWSVGAGANYRWNDRWQSRAGYYFYPAVVGESTWDPSIPDSDTHGVNIGGSWVGHPVAFDFSYSYLRYQPRSINNNVGASAGTTINGKYKTSASIFSFNINYKFAGAGRGR